MKRNALHHKVLFVSAFFALYLFPAAFGHAEDEETIPTPDGWDFETDIAYGSVSEAQRLDILCPPSAHDPCPAIVLIHGGGWYLGDKGGERTRQMMNRFAHAGFVSLSINYRMSDEARFPAAVEDCKLAVRWLRAHADNYRVNPDAIGAMGTSAGGHLSAMLAVTRPEDGFDSAGGYEDQSSAIQAAVPVCGPMDMGIPLAEKSDGELDPLVIRFLPDAPVDLMQLARRASPLHYVHPKVPPMLLIHGTADKRVVVDHSQLMAETLKKADAPCELILVKDGGHGMGIARGEDVFKKILAFFEANLQNINTNASAAHGDYQWWKDAKFGLFVHWGPVSLRGEEISWSRAGERPGIPGLLPGTIPVEEYDNLYREFNPVKFDAAEWVKIAKAAGMSYIILTTKHHDGFCMFDTQLTDYKITNSPYKKDIVAELARACHEGGVRLGLYYSLPDWKHPDYRAEHHQRYIDYLHGQLRELCSNYGQVDIIWFDGGGQGGAKTWDAPRLLQTIRELQPHVLINNRSGMPADYETPEQVIGRFETEHPWESCITLGQQWSWKPNDDIKTAGECIKLLVLCVGGGGNMLLNTGPMPNGEIEPRQVERLKEIGAWLEQYGESIYGTRGGPYHPSYWGACTHKDNKIYLQILNGWEDSLVLAPLGDTVVSSRLLTGGEANVQQTDKGLTIRIDSQYAARPVSIVELTLNRPASGLASIPAGVGIPAGATAQASNIRRNEANYAPHRAVDDDPLSRWAADDGVTSAWFEFQLPETITFDAILMDEAFGSRIQEFELQYKDAGTWKTFYRGTTVGRNWAAKFDPVTASEFRLDILKATDGPTLRDIRFHYTEGG